MPSRKLHLRFRLIVAEEYRPIEHVPLLTLLSIWILIAIGLAMQIQVSRSFPAPTAAAIELPQTPSATVLSAMSLGDEVTFGKVASLWLQAFDNQQGQSVPFKELDYERVASWLKGILDLDPKAQYPMFNAARIYSVIKDKPRVRIMLEFIRSEFHEDPALRWEWLATAATLAKNELEDLPLALEYANILRTETEGLDHVPNWAKQMEVFLLEEHNEFSAAATLLLNLIESGEVTDPQEFRLLFDRLEVTFQKMIESGQVTSEKQFAEMERKYKKIRDEYLSRNIGS